MEFRENFDYATHYNLRLDDYILWDNIKARRVTTLTIWDSIRSSGQPVAWCKLVCHKFIPPRFSFFLWLAFQNGMQTMDRLSNFGLLVNPTCRLCNAHNETFNHLFFSCPFSFQLLISVLQNCGWKGFSRSWLSITNFIISHPSSFVQYGILYLGFAAIVYHTWKEQNARVHGNSSSPVRIITHSIVQIIKCKLHTIHKFQKVNGIPSFIRLAI